MVQVPAWQMQGHKFEPQSCQTNKQTNKHLAQSLRMREPLQKTFSFLFFWPFTEAKMCLWCEGEKTDSGQ